MHYSLAPFNECLWTTGEPTRRKRRAAIHPAEVCGATPPGDIESTSTFSPLHHRRRHGKHQSGLQFRQGHHPSAKPRSAHVAMKCPFRGQEAVLGVLVCFASAFVCAVRQGVHRPTEEGRQQQQVSSGIVSCLGIEGFAPALRPSTWRGRSVRAAASSIILLGSNTAEGN